MSVPFEPRWTDFATYWRCTYRYSFCFNNQGVPSPPPPGTQADLTADVLVAKARRSIALLVNVMCDRFYIVTTEVDNQNCINPLFANKD